MDYEPVWKRCVELGVAVTQHSGSGRWHDRASISNFTYNHVGPLRRVEPRFRPGRPFLGGLVARYPSLNFGFMEGGISWACQMCFDLIEHWEKRRRAGLQYPGTTDVEELKGFHPTGTATNGSRPTPTPSWTTWTRSGRNCGLDELAKARARGGTISRPRGIGLRGRRPGGPSRATSFFGCESDDRATMWAFDSRMGRAAPAGVSAPTSPTSTCRTSRTSSPKRMRWWRRASSTDQDFKEFHVSPTPPACTPATTRTSSRAPWSRRPWRRSLGCKSRRPRRKPKVSRPR